MSNTRHASFDSPKPVIQQAPAIFVNATRVEVVQVAPTHAGIIVSNTVVSAQIPLDVKQLRQLSTTLLEFANILQGTPELLVPSIPGLVLP